MKLVGSADQPHTWSSLPDVGRAIVLLADAPEASGQVWHLPVAEPLTPRRLADLASHAAGHGAARISVLPGPLHRVLALGQPMLRELWDTRYQLIAPFIVDDRRFRAEIAAFTPTPHADAVAATVDWFREQVPA